MDFIDLAGQQRRIRENIDGAIRKVLSHGQYIMGPEIRELEEKLAAYVGVRHDVGCASGTEALLMRKKICITYPSSTSSWIPSSPVRSLIRTPLPNWRRP